MEVYDRGVMIRRVETVYENGVLRPLEPLPLAEHQHVTVIITEAQPVPEQPVSERSHLDAHYLAAVRAEVAAMGRIPTLDEIHKITSKDPSSWAKAIIEEREDRF